MSEEARDNLERRLAAISAWVGPEPHVWRKAAAQARALAQVRPWWASLERRSVLRLGGLLAAAVFIVVATWVVVLAPEMGRESRRSAVARASADQRRPAKESRPAGAPGPASGLKEDAIADATGGLVQGFEYGSEPRRGRRAPGPGGGGSGGTVIFDGQDIPFVTDAFPAEPRQVIRKATVELAVPDVRATFLKAQMILSQARGEYVESSSMTGSGDKAQAELTLRVVAERLDEVLGRLRELGDVRSETSTGEDVTERVVDLEAHLRNEQRVEKELLELLESRQDAPLADIMALRNHLANVRRSIESITAQRERLAHLVALAQVLVIVRHVDLPKQEVAPPGIGAHFAKSLGSAWSAGLRILAGSLGGIVKVLVGGLVGWLALLAVIAAAVRYLRTARGTIGGRG